MTEDCENSGLLIDKINSLAVYVSAQTAHAIGAVAQVLAIKLFFKSQGAQCATNLTLR
jgi:hypothetical protein